MVLPSAAEVYNPPFLTEDGNYQEKIWIYQDTVVAITKHLDVNEENIDFFLKNGYLNFSSKAEFPDVHNFLIHREIKNILYQKNTGKSGFCLQGAFQILNLTRGMPFMKKKVNECMEKGM